MGRRGCPAISSMTKWCNSLLTSHPRPTGARLPILTWELTRIRFGGYNTSDDIIDEFTVTGTGSGPSSPPSTLPTVTSLQCTAASLTSNASTTCTVNLSNSSTSSTLVALSNSASTVLTVPSSVSVAANATSATFTATAGTLLSDQAATLTATLNGSSQTSTLSLVGPVTPLTLSGVTTSSITATGATITWTTNKSADSQVMYGATRVVRIGQQPGCYARNLAQCQSYWADREHHLPLQSGIPRLPGQCDAVRRLYGHDDRRHPDSQILFQLHSDASEVSGVTNGSTITPAIAPSGFTGKVVVAGSGSVNFAPAQVGNGVYFLKCCDNAANAYYKFTGPTIGSIFNVSQGQISFYLKSRQSLAQRAIVPVPCGARCQRRRQNTIVRLLYAGHLPQV